MKLKITTDAACTFEVVFDPPERGEPTGATHDKQRIATAAAVAIPNGGALIDALRDWTPTCDDDLATDVAIRSAVDPALDRDEWAV